MKAKKPRIYGIRLGGVGGQGNVAMGIIFANALADAGKWVVQTQSYGAQVRGGLTKSDIIVSDQPINFPETESIDVLLCLHQMALDVFAEDMDGNAILILDTTYVHSISSVVERITRRIIEMPISQISVEKFSNRMFANSIALGILTRSCKNVVDKEHVKNALIDHFKGKFVEENKKAFELGYESVANISFLL